MMGNQRRQRSFPLRTRVVLLVSAVVVSLSLLAITIQNIGADLLKDVGTNDFTQYYAAARLLLQRSNPYDVGLLLEAERIIGWEATVPILMWNPPWTLVIIIPFTLFPFQVASILWLAINMAIAILCATLLWRIYGGRKSSSIWLGLLIGTAYMPLLTVLKMGQISLWLLLGITGYLVSIHKRWDYSAGIFLALLLIKPHVVYLFMAGTAWWIVVYKRWKVMLGLAGALVVACVVVTIISPDIFAQYSRAATSPPLYWRSATLGTWLRTLFGADIYWLQFLPSAVGLIAFIGWVLQFHGAWDMVRLAPMLLLASTVTAMYGWELDQVTLLPVVLILIAGTHVMRLPYRGIFLFLYILAQIGLLVQNQLMVDSSVSYWHPLLLAGLYISQRRISNLGGQGRSDRIYAGDGSDK